jgi:hypothetical protein
MKRVLLVLTVAAVLVVAMAVPALADAKPPHASCIGILASEWAPESSKEEPAGESLGEEVSPEAQEGGLGTFFKKENRAENYGHRSPNC